MEAKTYCDKAITDNDPIFDFANRIGNRLGTIIGVAMWFVKDYAKCFLLGFLLYFLPWKTKRGTAAEARGLKYAVSTVAAMLVVGVVMQIYLLLLCN